MKIDEESINKVIYQLLVNGIHVEPIEDGEGYEMGLRMLFSFEHPQIHNYSYLTSAAQEYVLFPMTLTVFPVSHTESFKGNA